MKADDIKLANLRRDLRILTIRYSLIGDMCNYRRVCALRREIAELSETMYYRKAKG